MENGWDRHWCWLACSKDQLNVVTWLVEHTVVRDDGRWLGAALEVACRYTQWNIVKWLVTNTQADVNYISTVNNNSALHYVIRANTNKSYLPLDDMTELCRLVYVCGKDVNVQGNDGNTPLRRICSYSNIDSVGALLLAGADETITNDEGQTPVQWAMKWRSVKVLSLMDVSSKWKLLVRSHRLRRRTAVRVMMTLVMTHHTMHAYELSYQRIRTIAKDMRKLLCDVIEAKVCGNASTC
jgi:hypothetical protein